MARAAPVQLLKGFGFIVVGSGQLAEALKWETEMTRFAFFFF